MDPLELLTLTLTALVLLGAVETVVVGGQMIVEMLGTASPWRLPIRGGPPDRDTAMALANAAILVGQIFVGCIVPFLAIVVVGLHLE